MSKKLCLIYNTSPRYREAIFRAIDAEYDCDWYFGHTKTDIKEMDTSQLNNVTYYHTIGNTENGILNGALMALWPEYKLYMIRGLAAVNATTNFHVLAHAAYGLLKGADIPMLLNNFQCESHKWAIERMLNIQHRKQCQNV